VSSGLAIAIHLSRIHFFRQLEGLRLQNLRRKTEMQRVLRVTDEAQRSLATSIAVGQRIVSILDLDALLDQVTNLIQERFRCYYVGIFLLDENDEDYILARAGAGQVGHILVEQGFRLKIGDQGIIGWVAAHRRPACVVDTLEDERYFPHQLLPDTRSELALPLEMGQQLLGVLDMESTRLGAFREDDVPFLQLLADQAATALHNARLYAQVNRFNQDLEKLVQQRTEALERMDRAKSDFISVTSHELRTPLTLLRGYGQMLADEMVVKQSDILTTMVNGILAGGDRLHAIVDNMLDVAKIDNRVLDLNPTTFSLKALLRLVCDELTGGLSDRRLTLEEDLQEIPHIEADLDALRKLFAQLVSNAIKYTPDGGKITLTGQQLAPGEVLPEACVEVVVGDTGIGIDPHLQELIFTKFYRTGSIATYSSSKTRFKGGGPGLGLSIAKGIVEAHGGLIWAESPGYDEQLCPGSKFHVILPLSQNRKTE
jgi:signal transduction histidine kinase